MASENFGLDCLVAGIHAGLGAVAAARIPHSSEKGGMFLRLVSLHAIVLILANLLLPRGPVQGPWQFILIMKMFVNIFGILLTFGFLHKVTQAEFTARNLRPLPWEFHYVFIYLTSFCVIIEFIAKMVVLGTNEQQFEAFSFGAIAGGLLLIYPYILRQLSSLHKYVQEQALFLKRSNTERSTRSVSNRARKTADVKTMGSTMTLPHFDSKRVLSPVKDLEKNLPSTPPAEKERSMHEIPAVQCPLKHPSDEHPSINLNNVAGMNSMDSVRMTSFASQSPNIGSPSGKSKPRAQRSKSRQFVKRMRIEEEEYRDIGRKIMLVMIWISVLTSIGLVVNISETVLAATDRRSHEQWLQDSHPNTGMPSRPVGLTVFYLLFETFFIWYGGGPWRSSPRRSANYH